MSIERSPSGCPFGIRRHAAKGVSPSDTRDLGSTTEKNSRLCGIDVVDESHHSTSIIRSCVNRASTSLYGALPALDELGERPPTKTLKGTSPQGAEIRRIEEERRKSILSTGTYLTLWSHLGFPNCTAGRDSLLWECQGPVAYERERALRVLSACVQPKHESACHHRPTLAHRPRALHERYG